MKSYRERIEIMEERVLSSEAALSSKTKGRQRRESQCHIRTDYQRDRDRILHSKAFRRLKHKTQVFISPEGDHYRTRLTHTLEVSQIARTVAKALFLNEDLAEAMALGHDLGHTPFGHAGEDVLDLIREDGFRHNEQSLRVVDILEATGGLNLTYETRDGILKHTGDGIPDTWEGKIVKLCDRVAYVNHDIDDALRGGIIDPNDIPEESARVLGDTSKARIDTLVTDLVQTSAVQQDIVMSSPISHAFDSLRDFLFERVYIGSKAKVEEEKAKYIIEAIYKYFMSTPEKLPQGMKALLENDTRERVVCDYVAGMTDRYILDLYRDLFLPKPWRFKQEE